MIAAGVTLVVLVLPIVIITEAEATRPCRRVPHQHAAAIVVLLALLLAANATAILLRNRYERKRR